MSDDDATGLPSAEEDFATAADPVDDEDVVTGGDAELEDDDLFGDGDGDEPDEEPGYVAYNTCSIALQR